MIIEVFGDEITKEDIVHDNTRIGCRGIVCKDDLYLVVRLKEWDIYTFPGGGLEENETLEECCQREVLEETGIKVNVLEKRTTVKEYFIDSTWINHYFVCEFVEDTGINHLTEEETELGLEKLWMTADDLLDQFTNNMTNHKNGPEVHNREFLGFINSI
jgi:8-oxo-dGTP diphosphatase